MSEVIGIDLGTTFSAVSSIDEFGKPYLIRNSMGQFLTPSVIALQGEEWLFGQEAKELQALGEDNVAAFFKRSMGDPHFLLQMGDKEYDAVALSALLLAYLKKDAEEAEGRSFSKAVITVPAYFSNPQRQATVTAAQQAGLDVLKIINEPTAAAIAYGMQAEEAQKLLIYDLGGGTFDVTIINYAKDLMTVIATEGDHELGGKDWDDRIVHYAASAFQDEFGVDPLIDAETFHDLLVRAENAKKQLSQSEKVNFKIVAGGEKGNYSLTRSKFEDLTSDLLERTQMLTERMLEDLGWAWTDLDGVLLVGGSTRMPQVVNWVEQMSGKPVLRGINVDEAVAMGAALAAFEVDKRVNQLSLPAAPVKIQDVMSHSLGMVAENNDRSKYINSIIIEKNKPVPVVETRPYTVRTGRNSTHELEVYMLQGESARPLDNQIIGKYVFSGIKPVKGADKTIIDVSYQYDESGIIEVSAKQEGFGHELALRIEQVTEDMSWLDEAPKDHVSTEIQAMSVFFAIDLSGSMSGQPLQKAQKAAIGFIEKLDLSNTSVGLISFADSVQTTLTFSQSVKEVNQGIKSWSIGEVGYGNEAQPFTEAYHALKNKEGLRFIMVLTDGVWYNTDEAIREAKKCHEAEIEVIAIGFGGADYNFLQKIASAEEGALLTDLSSLHTSLSKIGQEMTRSSGSLQISSI